MGKMDARRFSRFQVYSPGSFEFPDRTAHGGDVLMNIELYDLVGFARACIGDVGRRCEPTVSRELRRRKMQIQVSDAL